MSSLRRRKSDSLAKPQDNRSKLEQQAQQFILLVQFYGSGQRDATGSVTTFDFVANRRGVRIHHYDAGSCVHMDSELEVTLDQRVVLNDRRTDKDGDFKAGIYPLSPYDHKVISYDQNGTEEALKRFIEDLKPIGYPGMRIPINLAKLRAAGIEV